MGRRWIVIAAIAVMTVAACVAHYADAPAVLAFVLATIALAGLAWVVSFATEQVGERFGPAVTGVLQSTLGNLPEFFIVVFALSAGEVVVAQTSIIGSIFANALFVLGLAIVGGSRRADDGVMRFGIRLPKDTATLMLLASFLIVIVAIAVATHDPAAEHVKAISIIGAVALLATYAAWVVDYLRSDTPVEPEHGQPIVSMTVAVVMLSVAGVGAALVSDWFVSALTPAMDQIGISKAFAGLVIVAIAGNAVENVVGISLALKGRPDFAVSLVKNSVSQIAVFLFPVLVLLSLFFDPSLTFVLDPIWIGALTLMALAVWQITGDGEAALFEGLALVSLYVILATVAWFE